MDELVRAGKVRAVGLSQYSAERLGEAMRTANQNDLSRPCALQTWYNLVERESSKGRCAKWRLPTDLASCPSTVSQTAF